MGAKTQGSMLPLQSIVTLVGQMDDDSSRKDGSDKSWKETVRKVSEDVKEGWEGSKEEAARKAVDMKKKVKDFYFQNVSLENAYKVRLFYCCYRVEIRLFSYHLRLLYYYVPLNTSTSVMHVLCGYAVCRNAWSKLKLLETCCRICISQCKKC